MIPVTEYNIIRATLVLGAGPGSPLLSLTPKDDDCRFSTDPPSLLSIPLTARLFPMLPLLRGIASGFASADKHRAAKATVNNIQPRTCNDVQFNIEGTND
jgi:hypothetical protein